MSHQRSVLLNFLATLHLDDASLSSQDKMLAINFHDALRADVSSGDVQQEEVFKKGVTVLLLTAVVPTASRDSFLKHTVKILFRFMV